MLISRDILIRTLVLLVFTYVHKTRTTTNSRTAPANRTTSKSTLPTHTRTPRAPVSLGRDVKSEASLPAPRHGHALSSGEGTFRPVLTRLREGRAQDAKKNRVWFFDTTHASQSVSAATTFPRDRPGSCREHNRDTGPPQKSRRLSAVIIGKGWLQLPDECWPSSAAFVT